MYLPYLGVRPLVEGVFLKPPIPKSEIEGQRMKSFFGKLPNLSCQLILITDVDTSGPV